MRISSPNIAERHVAEELREKEEFKKLALQALELPLLPLVMTKAMKVAHDTRSGSKEMAEIISSDHGLTGNVLRIANSSYFGLSQEVPTVSRAILVLGFEAVRSIALSASVIEKFGNNGSKNIVDCGNYLAHSLACAFLSKKIATMTHRAKAETTFVCGLLHDIGKVILGKYFPESYRRISELLAQESLTSVEAETEVLGFTHAEMGMWLAQRWRLPKNIIFTIANHHGMIADDERYRSLTCIVRLADYICIQEGLNVSNYPPAETLDNEVIENLNLDSDDLLDLRRALAGRKEVFTSLFSN